MGHLSINELLLKANVFSKTGKVDEAKNVYQKILNSDPTNLKAKEGIVSLNLSIINKLNNIGHSFYKQGKLDEAIEVFNKVIFYKPNSAEAYYNIATILIKKNKLEASINANKKAIFYDPELIQAHFNMGIALQDLGKLNEAVDAYKKAISLKPDYTEAYFHIGRALCDLGKYHIAIEAYNQAILLNPDYISAYNHFANLMTKGSFLQSKSHLYPTILKLLQKNIIEPSQIAKSSISLLKCDPSIKSILIMNDDINIDSSIIKIISDLSNHTLLTKLMSVIPLPDLDLEALLTNIRSSVLLNISKIQFTSDILSFQSALALQCFINEYLYKESDEETLALKRLEHSIDLTFSKNLQPEPFILLCLASYRPLHTYDWSQSISLPNQFQNVSKTLIHDFFKEKKLSSEMPMLDEIIDEVSSNVRQQYEQNPYPKWTDLKSNYEPLTISELVKKLKLKLTNDVINTVISPDILIAGCGTGKQSINAASNYKNSNVLAIDLSLRSLAYAKRKTQELDINNIEYMQADILDLEKLDKQFDIIECGGVLHHMKDPMAGWQVLMNCLKPGGLMRVALYSELAREHIVEARNETQRLGIGKKNFEIKSFRNMVAKLEKPHHQKIIETSDFYDLSSFRDLVFHTQEHRFTIMQIEEMLSKLGMDFCGFEVKNEILIKFKLENKTGADLYNLEKWNLFEEMNKDTFMTMYSFWCQKI